LPISERPRVCPRAGTNILHSHNPVRAGAESRGRRNRPRSRSPERLNAPVHADRARLKSVREQGLVSSATVLIFLESTVASVLVRLRIGRRLSARDPVPPIPAS